MNAPFGRQSKSRYSPQSALNFVEEKGAAPPKLGPWRFGKSPQNYLLMRAIRVISVIDAATAAQKES